MCGRYRLSRPKRIMRNSLLGEHGIALILSVLEMGYLWHPTGAVDAGIDGLIELRDPVTGVVRNSIVQVQSKATEAVGFFLRLRLSLIAPTMRQLYEWEMVCEQRTNPSDGRCNRRNMCWSHGSLFPSKGEQFTTEAFPGFVRFGSRVVSTHRHLYW